MPTTLDHTHDGRVARLGLDFGDLNLFTPEAADELREAVASVDDGCSVLAITPARPDARLAEAGDDAADAGSGPAETDGDAGDRADPADSDGLSAGMDVDAARTFSPEEGRAMLESLYGTFQAVRNFDGVTVCGCGGYALGAGFELALSCDFRVAAEDAALGLPEVDVGIPTLIQGGLLIPIVGLARAKELCYLGGTVSGRTAAETGLVTDAVPAADHDGAVDALVDRLARKSPATLRLQQAVFRRWRSVGLERGMERSVDVAEEAFGTRDLHEAMDAFVEGRDPEFEGR